jgi:hypothetical protein
LYSLPEPIEADLLRLQIGARRSRGLGLEGPVHPLVAAVLLRGGRFDQLGADAEPNPPHRQRGQASERGRREGHAVVGPNHVGQAVLLKEAQEGRAASAIAVESKPWQASRYRLKPSTIVSG